MVSAQAPPDRNAEREFVQRVSADSAKRYARELAAFGPRMGGTDSNRRAALYLHQKFQSWSLPSTIVDDPEKLVHEEHAWRLQVIIPEKYDFSRPWPYGFSPSTARQQAEVVSAASTKNVKGKALLTEAIVRSQQYDEWASAGAVAILSDGPGRDGDFTEWAMISELPSRLFNPIPVFAISRNDGNRLRAFISKGITPRIAFELASEIYKSRPQTVIAKISGRSGDKRFIYCAHGDSDSGGPGADDNASGVAVVLETARVLQALITENKLPAPKHTIEFIVWGSEYFSTNTYIARHAESLQNVSGVINFDQAGAGTKHQAIYFESNEVPWNETLLRTLDAIGAAYCGEAGMWRAYTTNPSQGGTDAYAFLPPAFQGVLQSPHRIPATTIYTAAWDRPSILTQTPGWSSACWPDNTPLEIDYSRYYHSSGDIPEWTTDREPWRMAWAATAGGAALLRLLW